MIHGSFYSGSWFPSLDAAETSGSRQIFVIGRIIIPLAVRSVTTRVIWSIPGRRSTILASGHRIGDCFATHRRWRPSVSVAWNCFDVLLELLQVFYPPVDPELLYMQLQLVIVLQSTFQNVQQVWVPMMKWTGVSAAKSVGSSDIDWSGLAFITVSIWLKAGAMSS